ncbi:cadherin repeat domain-containing protein, partial [Paracoccaceae bacterium]|nr:cadherin repeat domain-containing protein [Paracoccaceae bacterium]
MKTELKKIKNINPVLGLLSLSACGGSAITNTALNKPVINYSINENSIFDKDTSDLFSSEVINYTISGADAGSFLVNSATGVVTATNKDYEAPKDVGANNIYNFSITGADNSGNKTTKDFSLTIVNQSFEINTIGDYSINENQSYLTEAVSVTGNLGNVSYSLAGNDKDYFTINTSTGVVTMNSKNFENALDHNTNNDYTYQIIGTDQNGSKTSHDVTVKINNLNEAPTITSTANTSATEGSAYSYT